MAKQQVLFDERFLDRHAGAVIADTAIAITELVANCWDAFATKVEISWPNQAEQRHFSIRDNGKGMTSAEFERRWRKLDYNKIAEEGEVSSPPDDLKNLSPRMVYGRNGRGRHAAFRFSDPYIVRTWRDGTEVTFEVRRGTTQPFELKIIGTHKGVIGHGTEIIATSPSGVAMPADEAREIIGTRFLADPNFLVSVDGTIVTFDDLSAIRLKETDVSVPPFGNARLAMIDTLRADKTTRQHGIAWRVKHRLVGNPGWTAFDHEKILDGRTSEAKRFQFIIEADFLADSVLPDWTGFTPDSDAWATTETVVHDRIKEYLSTYSAARRSETKAVVKENLGRAVADLPPAGRDRWNQFVDKVVDSCPSISTSEVEQVSAILANLELSTSKYGLINKLHDMPPGDLDQLHTILIDWTVQTAKAALDEIQSRLKLIHELDQKLRDDSLDEVADLQPLFERSLWVFGPEFESIEFTSNRGMTEVVRKIFGVDTPGSRKRPDFVVLPDGSVGFYSRDSHDLGHEVAGVSRLVVAEIKKVGVPIGATQKGQPWQYVTELMAKGLLTEAAKITCFVLGSKVEPTEVGDDTRWDGRVLIRPMSYDTFIRRAEARMLGLRDKLKNAPFLKEQGLDGERFITAQQAFQGDLNLHPTDTNGATGPR